MVGKDRHRVRELTTTSNSFCISFDRRSAIGMAISPVRNEWIPRRSANSSALIQSGCSHSAARGRGTKFHPFFNPRGRGSCHPENPQTNHPRQSPTIQQRFSYFPVFSSPTATLKVVGNTGNPSSEKPNVASSNGFLISLIQRNLATYDQ
jgi:hypothetical protein